MIVDMVVSVLLLASGVAALASALGVARLPDFFLRMHAAALVTTLASWAVVLATIVHFTAGTGHLSLHAWLVVILLAVAAPVTTVLLARAALFRQRQAGDDLPAPMGPADESPPS